MPGSPEEELTVRVSAEVKRRLHVVQLVLCDLGLAFPVVVLTPDGTFTVPCPVDERHFFVVWLSDEGKPVVVCPTCAMSPAMHTLFTAELNRLLPAWGVESVRRQRPSPITGWRRQPEGSPVVALRLYSNGHLEWLAVPGREDEADAWLQQ